MYRESKVHAWYSLSHGQTLTSLGNPQTETLSHDGKAGLQQSAWILERSVGYLSAVISG
jgi:hypothetical protein